MKKYSITSEIAGYVSKQDPTNLPETVSTGPTSRKRVAFLVKGSQNVLHRDDGTVGIRKGYTLVGAANSALSPVRSSFDWITNRGEERSLRLYDDELEVLYGDNWIRVQNGFGTDVIMNFADFWDTAELESLLLFVDGTSNIHEWNGAIAEISAAGTNALTIGSGTWAELGFYTTRNKTVVINGIDYTYTGGESTDTLTGVTPDPAGVVAAGDIAVQKVVTTANSSLTKPAAFASTYKNDLISVLNNQIYLGSNTSRYAFVSKQNNYKDFTQSSPRGPGEGVTLTLDGETTGFVPQEKFMYVSARPKHWYQVGFQLSADLTAESISVDKLKTAPGQAARSQALITSLKNEAVFISFEPTFDTLGRIENISTPQSVPLSDPIKTDFEGYDFSNAHALYHRSAVYIALPAESLLLIYDLQRRQWEPPQILPVRRLAVIGGELHFHSSLVPETYKLFDGWNDNSQPISARAELAYSSFGARANFKNFDELYAEGYISQNCPLTMTVNYELKGFRQILEKLIKGSDEDLLFGQSADDSLGNESIGDTSLSGDPEDTSETDPQKFRIFAEFPKEDFFEYQVQFSSDAPDVDWSILAFGPNARTSPNQPASLKK